MEYQIQLPKKVKIIEENESEGVYEIENLFPGYGYTLGHSLRRVILSSMPGASITKVKIDGVSHEFSTIDGVKEDVINIILNLKQIRFKMYTDEPQTFSVSIKGPTVVTAGNLKTPSQLEVMNKDIVIATLTSKDASINMELTIEKGLGYVPKEAIQKEKMEVGSIALDAIFSPIRKVNYEVENMRVGDRTDYNKIRISIETDSTIKPLEVLEKSIKILIDQFKTVLGENTGDKDEEENEENQDPGLKENEEKNQEKEEDVLKVRVEDLDFSTRTLNALANNGIRTVGGLVKKKEMDLLKLEGLGDKAIKEIRRSLGKLGLSLKEEI